MNIKGRFLVELVLLSGFSHIACGQSQPLSAAEIVKRSVQTNTADWRAQLLYTHRETDTKTKIESSGHAKVEENKTYEVLMIDGSPYYRLVALNNEPLNKKGEQQEQKKLQAEIHKRKTEPASDRQKRLAEFRSERSEEHVLMEQMTKAFNFKLAREEKLGDAECYVLDATPNPDYRPPVQKAKVLTGMRGKLWVEKEHFHWAKVEAEVISPVEFALFIARVKPGTKFELVQTPIGENWLPSKFSQTVKASVLGMYSMRSREEEQYFDYRRIAFPSDKSNLSSLQ